MYTDQRGMKALQQLRIDLQESAGFDFPQGCLKELLVLYDVCKYLDLNIFQAQDVLGVHGYASVADYINQPVDVNSDAISDFINKQQS